MSGGGGGGDEEPQHTHTPPPPPPLWRTRKLGLKWGTRRRCPGWGPPLDGKGGGESCPPPPPQSSLRTRFGGSPPSQGLQRGPSPPPTPVPALFGGEGVEGEGEEASDRRRRRQGSAHGSPPRPPGPPAWLRTKLGGNPRTALGAQLGAWQAPPSPSMLHPRGTPPRDPHHGTPSPADSVPVSPAAAGTGTAPGGIGVRGAFLPTPPPPSSSSSGTPPVKEAESPESPFEVVPDRAAFDREFGGGGGSGSVLSQIPEDRICDFPALPRTGTGGGGVVLGNGGVPPGKLSAAAGLCRQSSGTAAALEEVSKCVRDLHSFTSEMLSWDLVERGNGTGNGTANGIGSGTGAEADSSGDSDDTVIEEGPTEDPLPSAAAAATPSAAVTAAAAAATAAASPPTGPAAAAARRDWEEERQTLRALRELGDPPPEPAEPLPPPAAAAAPQLLLFPRLAARELCLWRDPRRSSLALGCSLLLLLSLAALSAVSVLAHLALALLCVTVSLRLYRGLLQALHKADQGHPFRAYLDLDVTLSLETFHIQASAAAQLLTQALRLLLRLFLVEDLVDSLKLAVAMWLLTYVGAVFNGITLLILADLLAFSVPPLYVKYKAQIDHHLDLARQQTKDLVAKIQAKLPGLAKKKPE